VLSCAHGTDAHTRAGTPQRGPRRGVVLGVPKHVYGKYMVFSEQSDSGSTLIRIRETTPAIRTRRRAVCETMSPFFFLPESIGSHKSVAFDLAKRGLGGRHDTSALNRCDRRMALDPGAKVEVCDSAARDAHACIRGLSAACIRHRSHRPTLWMVARAVRAAFLEDRQFPPALHAGG
jgi:hypothetical protein